LRDVLYGLSECWSGGAPWGALDGLTQVRFAAAASVLPAHRVFDGALALPSKRLSVTTSLDELLLARWIGDERVALTIWTDDPARPTDVAIVVR
jgi:hypothetical protein